MSDYQPGDIVADTKQKLLYKFLGEHTFYRWAGLGPAYDLVQPYDPKNPVLLAREHDGELLPALDLDGRVLVAVTADGAA